MELYFSPLACSMATRIALYEAGGSATYLEVDPKTKTVLKDGSDFRNVNPLGLVPTLRTDDGAVLTENVTLNFASVKVDYVEQKKDGSAGDKPSMNWNIAENSKD